MYFNALTLSVDQVGVVLGKVFEVVCKFREE